MRAGVGPQALVGQYWRSSCHACHLIGCFRSALESRQGVCDAIVKVLAAKAFYDPSPPSR